MMKQVVREGTGTAAALEGVEVAGKTGTAELNNSGLNQPWFMGFTPEVAVAVTLERFQGGTGGVERRADRQGRPRRRWGSSGARDRARHDGRRPLPDHPPARLGRHGRRLLRRGHAARPPGRAQAALPPLRRGRRVRRALPPRGLERRRAAAPQRRAGLRPRRVGRHLLHRDGVPAGPQPQAGRARPRRARAGARRRPRRSRSSRPRASRTGAGSCTATSSRTT